jgi:hypothetical protein
MKMSLTNRILILASAVLAGLVGWGFLRRPLSTSVFDMLNARCAGFCYGHSLPSENCR